MEPKSFDFLLNYKSFSVPARNKNLIDFPQEIFNALVFNEEHKYEIKSKVSEEVLQSFINYLIDGEVPEITITNFFEFSELSQEFNQLKEVIQAKQAEYGENLSFFEGLQSQNQQTRAFYEDQISQHLDDYLEKYGKDFIKLPIQTLHSIFTHKNRKFSKHDLAYYLIKYEYKQSNNSNIFILLSSLDGTKLSRENLEDSFVYRDLHFGMMPLIETDFLSNSIEKQNQIENQFIELKENFEYQRKIIDKLLTEINSLKENQINKSNEINELKNTIKNQSIQISEIEKKHKNELFLIQKNHENDLTKLNGKIENQSSEINELKNTIKNQSIQISEIEKKHKNDLLLIQKNHENDINSIKQKNAKLKDENKHVIQLIYNFKKSNRFNGIIDYLTQKHNGNVHNKGVVNLTASSILGTYSPSYCVDLHNEDSCFESNSEPNSWLCFDFKTKRVKINAYSIRTYKGGCNLQSWRIDGSNDNTQWKLIDSKFQIKSLDGCKYSDTFIINQDINQNEYFRYLRIQQTGETTGGNHCLNISAIEFFGFLQE